MQNLKTRFQSFAEVKPDFAEGNGISAQGKVNEVNDTLGPPPNVQGLKSIAPCKGNTSSIGATPRRQTTANQTTNVRKPNENHP